MALLQSFFMLYRHSAEEACMAAGELCAGVDATRGGVPVQQHMAEMAVRAGNQQAHEAPAEAGDAPVVATGRSYPRPDPAAIPKAPP